MNLSSSKYPVVGLLVAPVDSGEDAVHMGLESFPGDGAFDDLAAMQSLI